MKLDKDICFGGRYNKKIIRGIKINGHVIYPNSIYSNYNVYEIKVPFGGVTVYFDTTFRVDEPYAPYYDFGDGVENPIMGTETLLTMDYETGQSSYKNYPTYTYTKYGSYQLVTSESVHFVSSVDEYNPLRSVISLKYGLKDLSHMFVNQTNLTDFDLEQVDSLYNATDMSYMFFMCESLRNVDFHGYYLGNVTTMKYMLGSCNSLENADFSNCNLSSLTNVENMLSGCDSLDTVSFRNSDLSSLTTLSGFSNLPTVKVKTFDFFNCKLSGLTTLNNAFRLNDRLTTVNLSYADISNVESMDYMFGDSKTLTDIRFKNVNTSKVTSMWMAFAGCEAITSLDLSSWNTSNVTDMYAMFFNCKSLIDLDVSGWNTSKVTNMYGMFQDCSNLTALNLSSWRTNNVTKMYAMFYNCTNLQEVDIRNFDLSSLEGGYVLGMFENCNNLHTLRLDNCNNATINKIIGHSTFPDNEIMDSEGNKIIRRIYCKQENTSGLTIPKNWIFEYVN